MLASSCELPAAASRRILIQSDLSGSVPPKAYETYVTGYPVHEMECYAFARTWYAKEMPRPGCVWTHTLLVPRATLVELDGLELLAERFTRPIADTLDHCRVPLRLPIGQGPKRPNATLAVAHALARAFYRQPSRPVVLAEPGPDRGEALFLAIWAQLWPTARMELSFSSGSLGARKIDNHPFDLQVAPTNLVRDIVRSAGAEQVDLQSAAEPPADGKAWQIIAEDLALTVNSGFREFLHSTADEHSVRGDVPGVAQIFGDISHQTSWGDSALRELYTRVAQVFPSSDQASALKRHCLALADAALSSSADLWIIVELSSQDWGSAFASPRLGLTERISRLFSVHSEAAVDLISQLLEHSLNAFGERIAHDTIAALDPAQVTALLSRRPQFISTFVKLRPALAKEADFWRALYRNSHEILEALATASKANPDALTGVFPALFSSGLEYEANHFVHLFGAAAAEAIFTHRGATPIVLRDRWLDAVAARPDIIISTLQNLPSLTPEVVSGVAATYAPSSASAGSFPLEAWKAGMVVWSPSFAPQVGAMVEACAFTLALALRQSTPLAGDLAVISFATVHAAAEYVHLPSAAWSNLEPVVPNISIFKDWDRCERLRRALIFSFARDQWPLDRFFSALKDSRILRDVINSALHLSDGKYLLAKLIAGIEDGTVVPGPGQVAVLSEMLEGNVRRRR